MAVGVFDSADPDDRTAVRAAGLQHTRLYAAAGEIAAERMAEWAFWAVKRNQVGGLASLVCRVKREGAADWSASMSGQVWVRRLTPAHR